MKVLLAILKWIFIGSLSLILVVFILLALDRDYQSIYLNEADKRSIKVQKQFDSEVDSNLYYSLLATYGKNKKLAKGFELQCLLALSHYPELKATPIDFRVQPAFLPLSSRPDPKTILFPLIKRKYLVIISNESTDFFEKILLKNVPFNDQIGIIGHELAHTVFYQDKSALQLVQIAYCYEYDDDFHDQFERETDKRAIAHGLGYQLYDFAFFVRKAFGNSLEEILSEKGDTYLSPLEIAEEMNKYDFYRDSLNPPEMYFQQ